MTTTTHQTKNGSRIPTPNPNPIQICDIEATKEDFKNYLLVERRYSTHTAKSYLSKINKLQAYLAHVNKPIHALKDRHAPDFFEYINTPRTIAPSTQNTYLSAIKTYLSWRIIEGDPNIKHSHPCFRVESLSVPKKQKAILSIEEVSRITSTFKGRFRSRNTAIVETLYGAGLRAEELLDLEINNIHYKEKYLRVIGKGNKERLVPINAHALQCLKKWIEGERRSLDYHPQYKHLVFLNNKAEGLKYASLNKIIKEAVKAANIPKQKQITSHSFRRTFATHLHRGGADILEVKDMMGHKFASTTCGYIESNIDYLREQLEEYQSNH